MYKCDKETLGMGVHLCYKLKRVYMTKIKGRGISNWRNLMCKDGKDIKIRKDGEKARTPVA